MTFRARVCLPGAALLLTAAAGASAETGFYVGATAGASVFHENKSKLDGEVVDAWSAINAEIAPNTLSLTMGSSSLQKVRFAPGGLIGYRFMRGFAIEAAYIDLGQLHYHSRGTLTFVAPHNFSQVVPEVADNTAKARGTTLTALGILPLSPAWEIYGRAGIFASKMTRDQWVGMDVSLHQAAGFGRASGSVYNAESNSIDPVVGAGVAWHLPYHVSLRGEYTRFINVGNRNKTGEINIDLFNVGVTYSIR